MRPIEQALISVRAEEMRKEVRLLRSSDGLAEIDREEILGWSRAFEVPPDGRFDLLNLFFHHLPSGDYAIGRLTPSIPPHRSLNENAPGRLRSFFIQTMIVAPETFLTFGNNPVFLYQKALSTGGLSFSTRHIPEVGPISITGENRWLDPSLLRGVCAAPGIEALTHLMRSALDAPCTLFTGGPPAVHIISALFNLLPVDYRPELTFSTGLHFSPDRYLRLIGVSRKNPRLSEIRDRYPVPFLDLERPFPESRPAQMSPSARPTKKRGWPELIEAVLRSGRFDLFHRKLTEEFIAVRERQERGIPYSQPSADELNRLGAEWLAELWGEFADKPADSASQGTPASSHDETRKSADDQKISQIFRFRKPPRIPELSDTSQTLPLSIPEKLRNWLMEMAPDNTVLFFQDHRHTDANSGTKSDSEKNAPVRPPLFPLGREGGQKRENQDNRGESGKPGQSGRAFPPALPGPPTPAGRIRHEEPLMIFAERNRLFSPFQRLMAIWPGHEKRLLELDALIAQLLRGEYAGSESPSVFWRKLCAELPNDVEWAVREEYLHYIQALLTLDGEPDGVKSPQNSLAALDVLDLLLDELPL